jgi:hypothetical protein
MSSGEIVGNKSVYWRFRHDDKGVAKSLKHAAGKTKPGRDQVTIDGGVVNGHDGILPGDIGKTHGHEGKFLVTVRYKSLNEAYEAGSWIGKNVRAGNGGFFLTFTVPAITDRNGQDDDQPAEIRVDW